jgi:hypothetical protein
MTSKLIKCKLAVEIALFIGTTVALAVLAEKNLWQPFAATAVVCVTLYSLLKLAESSHVLRLTREWEVRERELLTTLEKCGIVQLFNMQDHEELAERNRVCRAIIDRGSEFSLSGSTGASYMNPGVHRHWNNVRARLESGCSFRLLLIDPFCKSKQLRDRLNGVTSRIDPKLDLAGLSSLKARYPRLQIHFTDEVYCSVFFSEDDMIYDPYHLGQVYDRLENRFLAMRLRDVNVPNGASYFRQLKNHFEHLWSTGVEWNVFADKYAERLRPYLDLDSNGQKDRLLHGADDLS